MLSNRSFYAVAAWRVSIIVTTQNKRTTSNALGMMTITSKTYDTVVVSSARLNTADNIDIKYYRIRQVAPITHPPSEHQVQIRRRRPP